MNGVRPDSENIYLLYPPAIVEACGGMQKFNELKTIDRKHLTSPQGSFNREVVTEPIMLGVNSDRRGYIILTFDVYDSQGEKIAEKISEVFHDDPCVYEWDRGVETWQGSCQIHGERMAGRGMAVLKIAYRILRLLKGASVKEPCRFNYGRASYIKLWNRASN